METKELTPDSLNEQQLLMLRLLKKPLPEASFIRIRQLAVELLAKQLDETIEEWEVKNGITEKDYEELSSSIFEALSKNLNENCIGFEYSVSGHWEKKSL